MTKIIVSAFVLLILSACDPAKPWVVWDIHSDDQGMDNCRALYKQGDHPCTPIVNVDYSKIPPPPTVPPSTTVK